MSQKRTTTVDAGLARRHRKRMPAEQRRSALIAAAVHEFARGGLHGTPVERIARRVGVTQPYVFALFESKQDLFLAAVGEGFDRVGRAFTTAAQEYAAGQGPPGCEDTLMAMGLAYKRLLAADRDCLMLQHHSYAACEQPEVRELVRRRYAQLVALAAELAGAGQERIDQFFARGMALNVAAAMGVSELSVSADWVQAEVSAASGNAG